MEDEDDCEIDEDNEHEEIAIMMSVLEEVEKEEHVLNFKGSIKDRITVTYDWIKGARDFYNDYFSLDLVFHEGFFCDASD